METKIVSDLPPHYGEFYLAPLRRGGLRAYVKELNIDGWIRSLDIYLIYDDEEELRRARSIVETVAV